MARRPTSNGNLGGSILASGALFFFIFFFTSTCKQDWKRANKTHVVVHVCHLHVLRSFQKQLDGKVCIEVPSRCSLLKKKKKKKKNHIYDFSPNGTSSRREGSGDWIFCVCFFFRCSWATAEPGLLPKRPNERQTTTTTKCCV